MELLEDLPRPRSLRIAEWLLAFSVVLLGLVALLTRIFEDEIIVAWARGNRGARPVYEAGGLEGLRASSITIPDFFLLALVMFITFGLFSIVLLLLLRAHFNWARWLLTGQAVFGIVVVVRALLRGVPPLFVALSLLSLVMYVALLVALWARESTRYLYD